MTSKTVFFWDTGKNDAVFDERGINFEIASEIVLDPPYTEHEDLRQDYGEPRFVSTGFVADVGIVTVVWTPRGRRRHIITAWRASKSEKEEYYANCAGYQGTDPPSGRPG